MIEGTLGMPLDAASGLPWLLIAILAVGVSLPVLMLIELGLNLSAQTAQVQALRKELRQAAAWVDSRLAAVGITGPSYPPLPNEAAAAVEALRSAGKSEMQSRTDRCRPAWNSPPPIRARLPGG